MNNWELKLLYDTHKKHVKVNNSCTFSRKLLNNKSNYISCKAFFLLFSCWFEIFLVTYHPVSSKSVQMHYYYNLDNSKYSFSGKEEHPFYFKR